MGFRSLLNIECKVLLREFGSKENKSKMFTVCQKVLVKISTYKDSSKVKDNEECRKLRQKMYKFETPHTKETDRISR